MTYAHTLCARAHTLSHLHIPHARAHPRTHTHSRTHSLTCTYALTQGHFGDAMHASIVKEALVKICEHLLKGSVPIFATLMVPLGKLLYALIVTPNPNPHLHPNPNPHLHPDLNPHLHPNPNPHLHPNPNPHPRLGKSTATNTCQGNPNPDPDTNPNPNPNSNPNP